MAATQSFRFAVGNDQSRHSFCAYFHESALTKICREGEVVRITVKGSSYILAVAKIDANASASDQAVIKLNGTARQNLHCRVEDVVEVKKESTVSLATRIAVAPFEDCLKGLTKQTNLVETYLFPFFESVDHPIPLRKGDRIVCNGALREMEFVVKEIEPGEAALVTEGTTLQCGDPVSRGEGAEDANARIGYKDIGGCQKALSKLRNLIELPLRHADLLQSVGVTPPTGVLLHGPPGSGKSRIVRALANETGASLVIVRPDILSPLPGELEKNLVAKIRAAFDKAPAILFFEDIDVIAPTREGGANIGDVEKRAISLLVAAIDSQLSTKGSRILLMAVTSRPEAVDPALRRFGRFDQEIEIGIPDSKGRNEILDIHTRNFSKCSADLGEIAKKMHGYVAADIARVCSEAALLAVKPLLSQRDSMTDEINGEALAALDVTDEHFRLAMKVVSPAPLRGHRVEVPDVGWDDIGGLDDQKRELQELIGFAEEYRAFGMDHPRGALLYGPPGCGKTLLAKAVASRCSCNFISVKGPELLSSYFGQSEANIRDVFDRARAAEPCVLFFDELDSIGLARGSTSEGHGTSDRILNQILTEMDGVTVKKRVFIIGATNRSELIDPALLRPGRLDNPFYVGLPDLKSRIAILEVSFRKSAVEPSLKASFAEFAEMCEGFSGADMTLLCQTACKYAIREFVETNRSNPGAATRVVKRVHLEAAMRGARPSVTPQEMEKFERQRQLFEAKGPKE